MKKIYQIPEVQVWETELSNNILEDSGEIGSGGALTNENSSFEEEEPSLEISNSNLWDD